ncbi:mitogen-activated protein kinase [Dichotomocladium elegans]|nr:mitogen-activated protein kinase [Dichotomocladium elegans]
MEDSLHQLCEQAFPEGLKAALITDKDGVMIMKCKLPDAPASVTNPTLSTTFAVSNNQASKFGLKNNRYIISMYDVFQLVQFDDNPLIITLIGDAEANMGLLINLGNKIMTLSKPLVEALQERIG